MDDSKTTPIQKQSLKESIKSILNRDDDRSSSIIELLEKYSHMRQLLYFFKIYIPSIVETKKTISIASPKELQCLESIFVDVSHSQTSEIVKLILINLDKLLAIDAESESKTAIKLCSILKSIVFSSPGLLQNRVSTEKLIIDFCDRLEKLKKTKIGYRLIIGDILSEMVTKLYLALSAYEKCETLDEALLKKSIAIKKSIGLPWEILLSIDSDRSTAISKLEKTISKYLKLSTDHNCQAFYDDLDISCDFGYCFVQEFWRKFLSNFALFRNYIGEESLAAVVDFVRRSDSIGDVKEVVSKESIIDFLSIFDLEIDRSIFEATIVKEEIDDISDAESIDGQQTKALKLLVINAIYSDDIDLESIFDIKSIGDQSEVERQLRTAIAAFQVFESAKKIDDKVKSFFKEYSNRFFATLPLVITKFGEIDISITLKVLTLSLDLFSSMITEKILDLVKYPIASVALTCVSLIALDRLSIDQKGDFFELFDSFLKFLRISTKKCNNLMISMAPNWMGVLRRMQLIAFELSISDIDELTPLFYRLGRFYSNLDRCKEFEKIAAFLIFDLVDLLRKQKLTDAQIDALKSGVYRLIGICDSYSINMITAMMDDTAKEIFRVMYDDYLKYYKYTGQV